jgi:hypothetical protein
VTLLTSILGQVIESFFRAACPGSSFKMGICFPKATQPKYKDEPLNPKPSAVVPTSSSPIYCDETLEIPNASEPETEAESNLPRVQLIGDMLCPFTLRVQIALQFKVSA